MSRQYNFIFSKLVDSPDNIVGLFAYGIYKQEKIAYIAKFKLEHGADPTEADLAVFHDTCDVRVEQYRNQAESRMSALMEGLMQDKLVEFKHAATEGKKQALTDIVTSVNATVQDLRPHLKDHAWSGVIGNSSFLILLALLFIILGFFGSDLPGEVINGVRKIFGFIPLSP